MSVTVTASASAAEPAPRRSRLSASAAEPAPPLSLLLDSLSLAILYDSEKEICYSVTVRNSFSVWVLSSWRRRRRAAAQRRPSAGGPAEVRDLAWHAGEARSHQRGSVRLIFHVFPSQKLAAVAVLGGFQCKLVLLHPSIQMDTLHSTDFILIHISRSKRLKSIRR